VVPGCEVFSAVGGSVPSGGGWTSSPSSTTVTTVATVTTVTTVATVTTVTTVATVTTVTRYRRRTAERIRHAARRSLCESLSPLLMFTIPMNNHSQTHQAAAPQTSGSICSCA
jgi:hypothetical protein